MSNPYVKFWYVQSHSNPAISYKVSQRANGDYACSCPHWKYRHPVDGCKHIKDVIQGNVLYVIEVQNTFLVKTLSTVGGWLERVDKGETFNPDFDDLWKQVREHRMELTGEEYTRLEGELSVAEDYWRTHK